MGSAFGNTTEDVLEAPRSQHKKTSKRLPLKTKTHYRLDSGSLGFIESLHKQ